MYEINLTLQTLPKSLNKTLRQHWRGQRKAGKVWDLEIQIALRGRLPLQPLQKARIRIVRHSWRSLDFDGLVGSLKPVVDALVTAGVLLDDKWTVVGAWDVDQKFRPKKDGPLLEIQVTDVS